MRYQLAEKNKIMSLFHKGESVSEIRLKSNVSKSTLYRWKEEYHTTGQVLDLIRKRQIDAVKLRVQQFQETHPNSDELFISKVIKQLIAYNYLEYAKELAEEVLSKNPKNIHVRSQLITIEKMNGNMDEVKRLCEELLKLEPNNLQAKIELIKLENPKECTNPVEKSCDDGLQTNYKDMLSIYEAINDAKKKGDWEAVEQLCERILQLKPNDIAARSQLIACEKYKPKPDWEKIERLSKEILLIEPDNEPAMSQLIVCARQKEEWKTIEELCERRLQLDEKDVAAMRQLVLCAKRKENWDKVEQLCRKIISLEPENIPARVWWATAARRRGDYDTAEHLYNEILKLKPDDIIAKNQLIIIEDKRKAAKQSGKRKNSKSAKASEKREVSVKSNETKETTQQALKKVRGQIQAGNFQLDDIEARQKEMENMGIDEVYRNILIAEAYERQNLPKQTRTYLKRALQETQEPKLQKTIKTLLEVAQSKKKKPSDKNPWDAITSMTSSNNKGQAGHMPMVPDEI